MAGDRMLAHPVEREVPRLFDEHGVAWEYEPRTFVLERHADGSAKEGFYDMDGFGAAGTG